MLFPPGSQISKQIIYMGQKLQDGKKVLCVSLNSPHSKRPPGQTSGLSNLPFWILGNHYGVNTHKKFKLCLLYTSDAADE